MEHASHDHDTCRLLVEPNPENNAIAHTVLNLHGQGKQKHDSKHKHTEIHRGSIVGEVADKRRVVVAECHRLFRADDGDAILIQSRLA